jgi:hypothetical protein
MSAAIAVYDRKHEGDMVERDDVEERTDKSSQLYLEVNVADAGLICGDLIFVNSFQCVEFGPDTIYIAWNGEQGRQSIFVDDVTVERSRLIDGAFTVG